MRTVIHERIKLYNKDGFDSANKKVRLYTQNNVSETFIVKAFTYNLEDGKVKKTKLSNKAVFKEEVSKHWESTKKYDSGMMARFARVPAD